ncbi:MAG: SDR family oxidoreductase [Patulibacter minatonensis]
MTTQQTALVTGANKGIGFEIARGLGKLGWSVGVGARDPERLADAVERLRSAGVDAFAVELDVTDDASVRAAARLLEERGRLDALVNNAGITGGMPQEPTTVDIETMRAAVETNVFGVVRVTNALLPLLRRAPSPRIVNVSSTVGSLTYQSDPEAAAFAGPIALAYSPSKTYLNGVLLHYVRALEGTGVLMNNVCPGYVATDLNGHRGTRTPEQGAAIAIKMATIDDDGPTGGYFNDEGRLPW